MPTVLRSGDAFNVVPGAGELVCDLRADDAAAFERVLAALPAEVGGATLHPELVRRWPGMHSEASTTAALLERAGGRARPPVAPCARGGASDASHFAAAIPLTVDGLGPRGGEAHNPDEFVLEASLATARRGRAGGDRAAPRSSRLTASDSSSRGRSSTSSSPGAPSRRTAATPPFLKSTRAAGEVVDDLRERRLVADDEHPRVAVVAGEQLERVVALEAVGEHVLDPRARC